MPARLPRILAVAAAAAASASLLVLAGCAALDGVANQTMRDESGAVVQPNDDADVFDVQVGDCIDNGALSGTVETVPQVPCDEPHDSEAFATTTLPDGEYPGEDAVTATASEDCAGDAFAEFVGVALETSELQATYLYPTSSSWAQGDREIVCLVYDPEQQTTGTLEASAR